MEELTLRIVFDRKNCRGFFVCTTADPANFTQPVGEAKADLQGGDEDLPDLWVKEIDADALDDAIAAAEGCPANVIKVVDDDAVVAGPDALPLEEEIERELEA